MKKGRRYKAFSVEAEYEPGSGRKVPKNLLGIKSQTELDRVENIALKQAEDIFFRKLVRKDKRFTAKDVCNYSKLFKIIFKHFYFRVSSRLSRFVSSR